LIVVRVILVAVFVFIIIIMCSRLLRVPLVLCVIRVVSALLPCQLVVIVLSCRHRV
jgi:hypothetical protein